MNRNLKRFAAFTIVGLGLLFAPLAASAAIRLTITEYDSSNAVVFSSTVFSPANLFVGTAVTPTFTVNYDIVFTDEPGNVSTDTGNLTQSASVSTIADPTGRKITFFAQVVNAANSSLALFSVPNANPVFFNADASLASSSNMTGSTFATTYVNGASVNSAVDFIGAVNQPPYFSSVPNPAGYTLQQLLSLYDLTGAGQLVTVQAASSVSATPVGIPGVPEPTSLAIWGLGMGALGFVGYRRSRKKVTA